MERENKKSGKCETVLHDSPCMKALRQNIHAYLDGEDLTIVEFCDKAEISINTMNNLLYGYVSDCKLSTVIAIARAMGITVDELVSADILEGITYENIRICRNLPPNAINLIRWFIRHQETLQKQAKNNERFISVLMLQPTGERVLKISNNFRQIDISKCNLPRDSFNKVFFAIKLNAQNYFPIYSSEDIILISNDRNPLPNEHAFISVGDNVYIVECRYNKDNLLEFYSIRDGKYRTNINKVDELAGYIVAVVPDTTVDGNR